MSIIFVVSTRPVTVLYLFFFSKFAEIYLPKCRDKSKHELEFVKLMVKKKKKLFRTLPKRVLYNRYKNTRRIRTPLTVITARHSFSNILRTVALSRRPVKPRVSFVEKFYYNSNNDDDDNNNNNNMLTERWSMAFQPVARARTDRFDKLASSVRQLNIRLARRVRYNNISRRIFIVVYFHSDVFWKRFNHASA